ncbi:hypothetical protein FRX31_023779 [Thalictrum thalictroides]|uniref:Uncharacterized protein n=1 Tax=Thalictrum thalictroides TaxID=46969 RepID=A0A7J6VNG5_THATH|nr:hypothetical protein FRX31_023779 [Thalictrum thalictroides]
MMTSLNNLKSMRELRVERKPNDYWIYERMVILLAKINKMNCIFYYRLGSPQSFCVPGMDQGLKILEKVKLAFDIPIVTDVHKSNQVILLCFFFMQFTYNEYRLISKVLDNAHFF